MSLLGIDFGNESCHGVVYKPDPGSRGTIMIVTDDSGGGSGIPSYIAFSEKDRIIGVAAKNQMVTNMTNTVFGFKRLLGRKFSDPYVQKELKHFPFKVEARPNDRIGIRVQYLGKDSVYSPEQLTAMLFTKLKECAVNKLQTPISDCVLSVPSYFTHAERMALLDAASIAGLNVLQLMNETTAAALKDYYDYFRSYKQYTPTSYKTVVFVNFGHSSLQVSACAFYESQLRVLATATDSQCGGRDIDLALAEYFTQEFVSRFNLDASKDQRTFLRLMQEVEKIKKQMSDTSEPLPLFIELEGRPVTSYLQRSEMEQICHETFSRFEKTLKALLHNAKLPPEAISSVRLIGESSRIPLVKKVTKQVFGEWQSIRHQDGDVPRGCALQCARLSPEAEGYIFSKFKVTDVQPYTMHHAWDAADDEVGEMEAGNLKTQPMDTTAPCEQKQRQKKLIMIIRLKEGNSFDAVPFSKMFTFFRKKPFSVKVYYSDEAPYSDRLIGEWIIHAEPTPEGESQKVNVEVLMNHNCIIDVIAPQFNVEKKQDSTYNESIETESSEDLGSQEPIETNAASQDQQNVPKNQEVEKKQDSTQNETVETQSNEDLGSQEPTETNAASQDQQNVPENQEFEKKPDIDSTQSESVETQSSEDLGSQEPTETNAASQDQQNVPENQEVKTEKTLIAGNEIACRQEQHKKEMEYIHELHMIQMENEKLKTEFLNLQIDLLNHKLADVKLKNIVTS